MDKAHLAGTGARQGITRLRPALEKLEQWLVGFPGRVLIRCEGQTVTVIPRDGVPNFSADTADARNASPFTKRWPLSAIANYDA